MNCPVCNAEIPSGEADCTECGVSRDEVRELSLRARALGWTVGLFVGVAVSLVFLAYFGDAAFFFSVWIVPPVLGWMCGEICRSYRIGGLKR